MYIKTVVCRRNLPNRSRSSTSTVFGSCVSYRRFYPAGKRQRTWSASRTSMIKARRVPNSLYEGGLKSVQGRKLVLKDRGGHAVKDVEYLTAPHSGHDLVLSLDLRLQYFAYRELKSAIVKQSGEVGLDCDARCTHGEILALANQPSFNPNDLAHVTNAAMRNRAITDRYEPGSTVKPLTVLAALESGRFSEDSVIDTSPGYMRIGRMLVKDPINRGRLSLERYSPLE